MPPADERSHVGRLGTWLRIHSFPQRDPCPSCQGRYISSSLVQVGNNDRALMNGRHDVEPMGSLERSNVIIPEILSLVRASRENCHLAPGIVPTENHHVPIDCRGRSRGVVHLVSAVRADLDCLLPKRPPVLRPETMQVDKSPAPFLRGNKHTLPPHNRRTASRASERSRPCPCPVIEFGGNPVPTRDPRP